MDKEKKGQLRKVLSWAALALFVLALTLMPMVAGSGQAGEEHKASILSGEVESGAIDEVIRGGGTLEAEAETVTLPSGVKITEFLVENGDRVAQGDPLAEVDKVSLLSAITEVQDTLDYLEDQMSGVKDEKVAQTVQTRPGGRVKQVYAQAGDDVQEVMLEYGSLAVLSLDGLMAVDVQTEEGSDVGEKVLLTLEDGTEAEGRVESRLSGVMVVTVEDEGYGAGQTVRVRTEDGQDLGSGELYIHSPWNATAYAGTVSQVSVTEEEVAYAGRTLFTLTDREYAAQLNDLSNLHREYEQLMQSMVQMYADGYLAAPTDGIVSGVDEDSVHLLSASGGEDASASALTAEADGGWELVFLSEVTPADTTPADTTPPDTTPPDTTPAETTPVETTPVETTPVETTPVETTPVETTPVETTPVETTPTEPMPESYTGYAAMVTASDGANWSLLRNPETVPIDYSNLSGVNLDPAAMTQVAASPAVTVWVMNGAEPAVYDKPIAAGDILLFVYRADGTLDTCVYMGSTPTGGQLPGGIGDLGDLSGLIGSMGGMGGVTGGTTQQTPFVMYDLEGSDLLTLSSDTAVTLTITVDEQDVSRIREGLTAQVSVEALGKEVYSAVVTEVGNIGANNGGSSKFTVELTMDRMDAVLEGMSAQAQIVLQTYENVPTVPVEALVEEGGQTLIYTGFDQETQTLTDPVVVTVGVSDGLRAQILTGLEAGDGYYYAYYDTLEISNDVSGGFAVRRDWMG